MVVCGASKSMRVRETAKSGAVARSSQRTSWDAVMRPPRHFLEIIRRVTERECDEQCMRVEGAGG